MSGWDLVKVAAALILEELRRKLRAARFANSPTAATLVTCDRCGARVPADAASMAAHRCPS